MKRLLGSRFWQDRKMLLWDLSVLIVLGFFLFMFGNGNYTLFDNSEPHYSRVSQELAQNSDKLSLTFNGEPWYVHPPLYFWMTHALTALFGWSEFVLRFWEGFFGILGLIATYFLGKLFYNRKTGLLAALLLGSSLYYIVLSRLAIFDTVLNTFMLLTLLGFFYGLMHPTKRAWSFVLGGVCMGLAIMTKGPIGLVQPGAALFIYILWTRQRSILSTIWLWIGIGIALLISAPWYIYELIMHGQPFFEIALKDYTWYRFFDVVEGQTGTWYFYFPVLLGFFPWMMYLPSILFRAVQNKIWQIKGSHDAYFVLFCWIFIVFTFVFFSLAQTKLPSYILGIFPFLSLLIAHDILHTHEKPLLGSLSLLFPISASILLFTSMQIPLPAPYTTEQPLVIGYFLILTLGGWGYCLLFLRHRLAAVGLAVATLCISTFYLTHTIMPSFENYKEPHAIVQALSTINPPYQLVSVNSFSPYMKYYLNRNIYDATSIKEGLAILSNNPLPAYLIINYTELSDLKLLPLDYDVVSKTEHKLLVLITTHKTP